MFVSAFAFFVSVSGTVGSAIVAEAARARATHCSFFHLCLSIHTAHVPHRFGRPLLRPVGAAVAGTVSEMVEEDIVNLHVRTLRAPASWPVRRSGQYELGGALKYGDDGA